MKMQPSPTNWTKSFTEWWQRNRVISLIVILSTIFIAVASFADAIQKFAGVMFVKPRTKDDWNAARWEGARSNINWVMTNEPTREHYRKKFMPQGKYDAVLGAHKKYSTNQNAWESIRDYGPGRTKLYLESRGQ